jgi:hypothetical protein
MMCSPNVKGLYTEIFGGIPVASTTYDVIWLWYWIHYGAMNPHFSINIEKLRTVSAVPYSSSWCSTKP